MARGQIAKQEIMTKILNFFGESAFLYNDGKEIRINTKEDGELVQIKVTLTASKTAVLQGEDNAIPGEKTITNSTNNTSVKLESAWNTSTNDNNDSIKVTEKEKENVANLLAALGL